MIWYCNFTLGCGIQRRVLEYKEATLNQWPLKAIMCSMLVSPTAALTEWLLLIRVYSRGVTFIPNEPGTICLHYFFPVHIIYWTLTNTSNRAHIFWDLLIIVTENGRYALQENSQLSYFKRKALFKCSKNMPRKNIPNKVKYCTRFC